MILAKVLLRVPPQLVVVLALDDVATDARDLLHGVIVGRKGRDERPNEAGPKPLTPPLREKRAPVRKPLLSMQSSASAEASRLRSRESSTRRRRAAPPSPRSSRHRVALSAPRSRDELRPPSSPRRRSRAPRPATPVTLTYPLTSLPPRRAKAPSASRRTRARRPRAPTRARFR